MTFLFIIFQRKLFLHKTMNASGFYKDSKNVLGKVLVQQLKKSKYELYMDTIFFKNFDHQLKT